MPTDQRSAPPPWVTLVDLLEGCAQATPDQGLIYLADGEHQEVRLSYRALQQQAKALAATLQQRFQPGDRAVLLFGEGLDLVTAFFGTLYAGMAVVLLTPPRPGQPVDDLTSLMTDAQPSVLLTTAGLHPFLQPLLAAAFNSALPVVTTDAADHPDPSQWQSPALASEDLAALLYTSGSTSQPRGVKMTHGQLMLRLRGLADILRDVDTAGFSVNWLPMQHLSGLFGSVLQPMYMNVQPVVLPASKVIAKPVRWLEAMTRFGAASSGAPNFAFQMCLDRIRPEECQDLDLSRWNIAITGAEMVRSETLEQFAHTYAPFGFRRQAYHTTYGLSEAQATFDIRDNANRPSTLHIDTDALEQGQVIEVGAGNGRVLVGCGQTLPGQEVIIVDAETRQLMPPTHVGEIWIRGPQVADGYWQQPEATQQTFQAHLSDGTGPYLRSGDMGFFHGQDLYITGRLKEMVIIRGKNFYAVDLELAAEKAHPALLPASSAAFSIPVNGEEQLVLIHEVRAGQTNMDVGKISSAVRRLIGEHYALPVHSVVVVEAGSIPRTGSGKIRRAHARTLFLAELEGAASGE
ncbi:fatty acyl-AMP ligase [Deinococcus ruber]|uniref:Acyl-CoA synthetase n=1 Tax=Deinococcus ruber TaxID=1848197 RepID=A0A918CCU7_9DEIO|nr:fatty acyl-AMP ligase [Deinococcus ruber]GGR16295.1 acyl-CoA synthetase [Deinococcus ruber]